MDIKKIIIVGIIALIAVSVVGGLIKKIPANFIKFAAFLFVFALFVVVLIMLFKKMNSKYSYN